MTLAHLLNTATNARVWHHPQPDLIMEALQAHRGQIDKREAFWRARYPIIRKTWAEGLIHGETDHLMTPFCDMLAEEIPDAKFIIFVRDPRDFVRSGMRRGYYKNHAWDPGRLRPMEGTSEHKEWQQMSQFQKVCWLWNETYSQILTIAASFSKKQYKIVRFEDLIQDVSVLKNISAFLNLRGLSPGSAHDIIEKKLNQQNTGNFPIYDDWADELKTILYSTCANIAEKYHYNLKPPKTYVGNNSQKTVDLLIETKNPKLLFLELPGTSTGGHLDHIIDRLSNLYVTKYVKTTNHDEMLQLINWADIVWLEWANQLAIHVTNKIPQLKSKKVLCRLHGYEVFTDMPAQINWEVVDNLIFVAKHKQAIFNQKFKIKRPPQIIIRNGVDTTKFTIPENKKNTKKLVLLGHLNFRKGLPLLLHFYHELLQRDPEYFLYIRGEFQDPRLEMAAQTMIEELELRDKIEFVG
ncbi:MAG: sulfotransferase [Bacteroidota bacterium]